MNATITQIEQANDASFIAELYSAASDIVKDGEENVERALTVIELIEDGKLLEAVMIELNF